MDLLRKTSLSQLVFRRIVPRFSIRFSFLFFFISLCIFSEAVFSEVLSENTVSLKSLKIAAFKRELRLPEPMALRAPHQAVLYGFYRQNRFQEILQAVDTLSSDQRDVYTLLLYGNSLFLLGQTSQSVAAYQAAFQTSDVPQVQSAALANFALVFSTSQRWAKAVHWLEKALEIDRDADAWQEQGLALSQLGAFYFKLGDAEKGAAAHIEALEIAETIPIPWLEARQLSQLAHLYYRDQTLSLARDYYQKSLKIYETLDDPLSEAGVLSALSFVYKDLSDFDTALSLQFQALAGYRKLQDEDNLSKIWLNLSLLYRDDGQHEEAFHAAEKALHLQSSSGKPGKLAEIEGTIGTIHEKKGEWTKALHHLKKARAYFKKTGASQEIHIVDLRIQALQDRMP